MMSAALSLSTGPLVARIPWCQEKDDAIRCVAFQCSRSPHLHPGFAQHVAQKCFQSEPQVLVKHNHHLTRCLGLSHNRRNKVHQWQAQDCTIGGVPRQTFSVGLPVKATHGLSCKEFGSGCKAATVLRTIVCLGVGK
jgi:hypothetical protein